MESSSPVLHPSSPTSETTLDPLHCFFWDLPPRFSLICAHCHLLVYLCPALSTNFLELSLLFNPSRSLESHDVPLLQSSVSLLRLCRSKVLTRADKPYVILSYLSLWPLRPTPSSPAPPGPFPGLPFPSSDSSCFQGLGGLVFPAGFAQSQQGSPSLYSGLCSNVTLFPDYFVKSSRHVPFFNPGILSFFFFFLRIHLLYIYYSQLITTYQMVSRYTSKFSLKHGSLSDTTY